MQRLTLAISESKLSSDLRREYSFAMVSQASSVSLGFMHRAMWMYFLMNLTVRIRSLKNQVSIKFSYTNQQPE